MSSEFPENYEVYFIKPEKSSLVKQLIESKYDTKIENFSKQVFNVKLSGDYEIYLIKPDHNAEIKKNIQENQYIEYVADKDFKNLKIDNKFDQTLIKQKAINLRNDYSPAYAFPQNTIDLLKNNFKQYEEYAKHSVVYYDKGDEFIDVYKLSYFREAVNMTMSFRNYITFLGSKKGYYGTYYEKHNKLAPNIAIFCRTRVFPYDNEIFVQKDINVINSIGYGFDTPLQPDYNFFSKNNWAIVKDEKLYLTYQKKIIHKIFCCAIQNKLTNIIIGSVGAGYFGAMIEGGPAKATYFLFKAIRDYISENLQKIMATIKEISFMTGKNYESIEETMTFIKNVQLKTEKEQRIPDVITNKTQEELNKTLFVNAWDPWSIVGNGNAVDESLDGRFGRRTDMSILSWPVTNPWIKYQQC